MVRRMKQKDRMQRLTLRKNICRRLNVCHCTASNSLWEFYNTRTVEKRIHSRLSRRKTEQSSRHISTRDFCSVAPIIIPQTLELLKTARQFFLQHPQRFCVAHECLCRANQWRLWPWRHRASFVCTDNNKRVKTNFFLICWSLPFPSFNLLSTRIKNGKLVGKAKMPQHYEETVKFRQIRTYFIAASAAQMTHCQHPIWHKATACKRQLPSYERLQGCVASRHGARLWGKH